MSSERCAREGVGRESSAAWPSSDDIDDLSDALDAEYTLTDFANDSELLEADQDPSLKGGKRHQKRQLPLNDVQTHGSRRKMRHHPSSPLCEQTAGVRAGTRPKSGTCEGLTRVMPARRKAVVPYHRPSMYSGRVLMGCGSGESQKLEEGLYGDHSDCKPVRWERHILYVTPTQILLIFFFQNPSIGR